MSKHIVVSFSVLSLILLLSCTDQSTNIVSNDDVIESGALAKTVWLTSQEYNINQPGFPYTYNFSFEGYNYSLIYQFYPGVYPWPNSIELKVNNTTAYTINYTTGADTVIPEGWTGWYSFNYNNRPMQFKVYLENYFEMMSPIYYWHSPQIVQVQVTDTLIDVPSGFGVSPAVHNNLNQVVTVSWNASTDTDVTGYEIVRNKYYLDTYGTLHFTSFTLVQTINSRTVSSWQDSPSWGETARTGVGYYYRIRAVSSTLNMQSGYTAMYGSVLEDYEEFLP